MKINTQLTEKVAKILQERNVLDVATLLTWETKHVLFEKLFKSNEDFYGIAGLLWEFILKYHPERATKFAAPAGQKKLKLINNSITGFPKFLKCMLISNPVNFEDLFKADPEARIVDLGCRLSDEVDQPDKLYLRKCYYSYFNDHVFPIFEEGKNILIGGAKGIGKSVFSIILILLLFHRGHIVLFDRYGIKFLIVPTNCNPELLETIKSVLLDQQIDPSNLPSDEKIFEVPDDKAFLMLGRIKEIVLVQDVGDDPNIVLLNNGQGRKIWVTSPNSSKLKEPLRENLEQRVEICLPPWELDEVLFVNKHLYSDKLSTEDLMKRFNLIGGNLRLLFFAENLMEDYQKALEEISYAELKQVLSSAYTDIPKGKLSEMFIHPVPKSVSDV